jgi:hypothetical protein
VNHLKFFSATSVVSTSVVSVMAMLIFSFTISTTAQAELFSIDQMPIGGEVTVPPSAKTVVPMGARVKISSTDNPQTIRIVPIGDGSTFATAIQLALYDSKMDRVKYINVSPNAPFLYSFHGLSSISIVPSLPNGGGASKSVRIQIESDKAVTFAR